MHHDPNQILRILDDCCDAFTFPRLDNGYVYLAATRLTAFHSPENWALVIEVFGYSPRSGFPDIHVYTFANELQTRDSADQYVNETAYEAYLANNPNNDSRFFFPIEGEYQDGDCDEVVSDSANFLILRGKQLPLPRREEFGAYEIDLESDAHINVYEICRFLAASCREQVLADPEERRVSVHPEMEEVLQLEEWCHPDLINGERPSTSATFQQIASVLATGDSAEYSPVDPPNTHWRNWPEGGTL